MLNNVVSVLFLLNSVRFLSKGFGHVGLLMLELVFLRLDSQVVVF